MLDDFKNTQPIAYKMITNTIKKGRCSHAYIIEANDTTKALEFSICFAKYLFCPYNYTNLEKCQNCHQCQTIDDNNYIELKILQPDGLTIKKQQLSDLQREFTTKSLIGTKKIYIINEADKLNTSSANTILKFLEEPEANIIAILVTSNIYNIIPTILSRCQIISLKTQNNNNLLLTYDKNQDELIIQNKIQKCIDFVLYFEKYHLDTLCETNRLWLKDFKDKENCLLGFDIMIAFYKSILDAKLNIDNFNFCDYQETIDVIKNNNSVYQLCKKINILIKNQKRLQMNANVLLLMDKLIIELERSR